MSYLTSIQKLFLYYKKLADNTLVQLNDEQLFWQYNTESNSIAVLLQHISGNMLSRFTDFLTTDGEKDWRDRDAEFEMKDRDSSRIIAKWENSWEVLFENLTQLKEDDLEKIVYIRNEGHTVIEAINRQLMHYPYHIGQIVMLGKMLTAANWRTLSIPKGASKNYNDEKFAQEPHFALFTDEMLRHLDG